PLPSRPTPPPLHYPPSLHDALPISIKFSEHACFAGGIHYLLTVVEPYICWIHTHGDGSLALDHALGDGDVFRRGAGYDQQGVMKDRKSTRLNSSHVKISYAVFCLKK